MPPSATQRVVLHSAVLPAPRFRYSPVVLAGGFAFVSGLVGLDTATGALASGGAFGQTAQVLRNLQALVDEQGWSLAQLAMARVYCVDAADMAEVNRAWDLSFERTAPPARSFVVVNALPLGARVEIEFQFLVAPAGGV